MCRMRLLLLVAGLAMSPALAIAEVVESGGLETDTRRQLGRARLSADQCGLSTPFNVLVDSGGVWLYRDNGVPREIFFHAGQLSVDAELWPVGGADAQRLRQLEVQAQQLMPQVAGLADEAIDLAFDALDSVVVGITGSQRKARNLTRQRQAARGYIERTLGRGRWDQAMFDDGFEDAISDAARSVSAGLTRSVLWQVLSGRGDAIDARMQRIEPELEQRMERRAEALEARAKALCPQLNALYALQQTLDFRYQGRPLPMFNPPSRDIAPALALNLAASDLLAPSRP